MKHYCVAVDPPCFERYVETDEPDDVACWRRYCPTRSRLQQLRAMASSTVQLPGLRQQAAARKGAR